MDLTSSPSEENKENCTPQPAVPVPAPLAEVALTINTNINTASETEEPARKKRKFDETLGSEENLVNKPFAGKPPLPPNLLFPLAVFSLVFPLIVFQTCHCFQTFFLPIP